MSASTDQQVALSLKDITKRFGGLTAVSDVSFDVVQGWVTGIVGANGAGKSTLFDLITAFQRPTAGRIVRGDAVLNELSPQAVVSLGVVRTFQHVRLFLRMSVLENVMVAFPSDPAENVALALVPGWRKRERDRRRDAAELVDFVGLPAAKLHDRASELSYGQQKLLSIARLLATGGEVLLLDEPSSGLDPLHLERMLELLRRMRSEHRTILLIEHNLDVVRELVERLVFMDRGTVLAEGHPDTLLRDSELAELYFGQ